MQSNQSEEINQLTSYVMVVACSRLLAWLIALVAGCKSARADEQISSRIKTLVRMPAMLLMLGGSGTSAGRNERELEAWCPAELSAARAVVRALKTQN